MPWYKSVWFPLHYGEFFRMQIAATISQIGVSTMTLLHILRFPVTLGQQKKAMLCCQTVGTLHKSSEVLTGNGRQKLLAGHLSSCLLGLQHQPTKFTSLTGFWQCSIGILHSFIDMILPPICLGKCIIHWPVSSAFFQFSSRKNSWEFLEVVKFFL